MKGPMPRANRLNFVTWLRWHMRRFTSRVRISTSVVLG